MRGDSRAAEFTPVNSISCSWMVSGPWAHPEIPASEFYRSYIATYLELDVRQLINITSLRDF